LNIGFVQFASGEMHFAGMLEIVRAEYLAGNSINLAIWGSKTRFPTRMSENFQTFSKGIPRNLQCAISMAAPNHHLANALRYDSRWTREKTLKFRPILRSLSSIEDFSKLYINDINPGPALANEFVTLSKSRNARLNQNFGLLEEMLISYLQVYNATQEWLRDNAITKMYLFNGRFLHERAAWDAAKSMSIQTMIFETTRDNLHIRELGFHNRVNNQKLIREHWESSPLALNLKREISDQWFMNMRSGANPFTTNSSNSISISESYFVYFSNSDDEAVGFWDQWNQGLGSQIDCVRKLIGHFEKDGNSILVIRLHPNLASKPQTDQAEWKELKESKFVKLILPLEKVSSYSLIESSSGVITFGSTIGIEAAYMSKPVMVLADCKFDELGFAFKPRSWNEAFGWFAKKFTPLELDINRELSRSFGFFVLTGGQRFMFSKLREIGWGRWKVESFLGFDFAENFLMKTFRKILLKLKLFRKAKVRGI
jgi:hypothetical protein